MDEKIKKKVQLTLSDDMLPGVLQYMETHGIDSMNGAIRGLLTEALAVTPRDGTTIAAAKRAFVGVQQMLFESVSRFHKDMSKEIDTFLAQSATQRFNCPHCGGEL